jgi:hypothetical protein
MRGGIMRLLLRGCVRQCGFVALCATLATVTVRAQDPDGPDLSGAPRRTIQIDDQILDADLFQAARGSQGEGVRPAGAPIDAGGLERQLSSDGVTFGGWDYGVLPIEFDAAVTTAHRAQFFRVCQAWGRVASVSCVERTSQSAYVRVEQNAGTLTPCFASLGQFRRLTKNVLNLGGTCWNADSVVFHELGHALGLLHEHQRPDRDAYISVDVSNLPENALGAYSTIALRDPLGQYDFLSIMHYRNNAFASDPLKPVLVPKEGYASYATTMGTSAQPTDLDHQAVAALYRTPMRPLSFTAPLQAPRTRFSRGDFLDAMERLHAFYYSRMGLNRDAGLSIGGRPDFQGIATWIFDVYMAARSRGFSAEQSFQIVVADITRGDEWRAKHPGETPLSRPNFTPLVSLDRQEFLDALQRLDAFYRSAEGLQRPEGLSIAGGPDFLGIAAWMFDVYLNERLSGASATVAWTRATDAIRATDEWRSKH